ncbi:hypothetical protein JZU48_01355, partial [bacterium]|nr:hypothetical protein [bacterium]
AMAHAGAHVFVTVWRPDAETGFLGLIEDAALAQSVDPASLGYHLLPMGGSGASVLDGMRSVLEPEIAFPDTYAGDVDTPLSREDVPFVAEVPSVVLPVAPAMPETP